MSMNLQCEQFEIPVQIPTCDTYLILSYNEEGDPDGGWEGVLRRYVLWLERERQVRFNQAVGDEGKQEYVQDVYTCYIKQAKHIAKGGRALNFYTM